MNREPCLLFELATQYAELAGSTNTEISEKHMDVLMEAVDYIWVNVNTPGAMKLFTYLRDALGEVNRQEFTARVMKQLRDNHSDYVHRVRLDSAGPLVQSFTCT